MNEDNGNLCQCGAPGAEMHPCPYYEENDEDDLGCNCCKNCESICAADI